MKTITTSQPIIPRHAVIFIFGFLIGGLSILIILKNDLLDFDVSIDVKSSIPQIFRERPVPINLDEPLTVDNDVLGINDNPGDNNVADTLFSSVKILCLINTSNKQIENRAIHVNNTWAKRCNRHIFLSHHDNISLPFLDFGIEETRSNLWDKIRALFRWVLKNEIDNYDFFLKADDDSYFIMENLRFMLLPYNPDEALYFGARFKYIVKKGYMSGGAGYILSREAIRQLVPAFDNPEVCAMKNGQQEDAKIGNCAGKLNFTYVDTRDHLGRHRMLPFSPTDHLTVGLRPRHFAYLYYPYPKNETIECCADHMISFHYISKDMMHAFEFLIYHVQVLNPLDKLWIDAAKKNSKKNMTVLESLRAASVEFSYNSNQ